MNVTDSLAATKPRFGFACKFLPEQDIHDKKQLESWLEQHNIKGTTVTSLLRLSFAQRVAKISSIVEHNAQVLCNQMRLVASWPVERRMLRIGSECFPCYTHEAIQDVYKQPQVRAGMAKLSLAGAIARQHDIRLSMHPGQYSMLVSKTPDTVLRSIEDIEYHAEIFRLMGYDGHDARQEINIHGGAKSPDFVEQFRTAFSLLADDTKRWLSVENDENSYCLDDLLPLADEVKICLDINHYWIHQGHYIDYSDTRLNTVIDSWRGVRPEMHVAFPLESFNLPSNILPDMNILLNTIKRKDLRAHSYGAWNTALNSYAIGFADRFDLMFEGKSKNLAAKALHESWASSLLLGA